jgi:hypothetical protein
MNIPIILLLVLFIVLICKTLSNIKIERFKTIDSSLCIDEDTQKVRSTTKDEKKELEKTSKKPLAKSKDKVKPNNKAKTKKDNREVFLIYGSYTYPEAKEICKLYKGDIASLEQLDEAFKKGANWCTWGWLNEKYIAYPVQESYWKFIEKQHKGFCGPTAGVNKIKNIDISKRFSINCFGIKPKQTKKDLQKSKELIKCINKVDPLAEKIRKCKSEKKKQAQDSWVVKQKKNLFIVGFNETKWSIYNT